MLSIGLVKRSSDAVRYYEKDDYYTRAESEETSAKDELLALAGGDGHELAPDTGIEVHGGGTSSDGPLGNVTSSAGGAGGGGGGGSGGDGDSRSQAKHGDHNG